MKETVPDVQGPGWYTCPGCAEGFDPATEAELSGGKLRCPFCSTRLAEVPGAAPESAPAAPTRANGPTDGDARSAEACESFILDDDPQGDSTVEPPEEQEISRLRVRQLSALRRGAYRSRSYCLICVAACVFGAVKLLVMTERYVHFAGWRARPVGYAVGALAALMVASFFWKQVASLTRELSKPALEDPETDPDFSTLSDGSQHWKRLEEM